MGDQIVWCKACSESLGRAISHHSEASFCVKRQPTKEPLPRGGRVLPPPTDEQIAVEDAEEKKRIERLAKILADRKRKP